MKESQREVQEMVGHKQYKLADGVTLKVSSIFCTLIAHTLSTNGSMHLYKPNYNYCSLKFYRYLFCIKGFYDLRKSSAPHPLTSPPSKRKRNHHRFLPFFLTSTTVNWLTVLYDNLNQFDLQSFCLSVWAPVNVISHIMCLFFFKVFSFIFIVACHILAEFYASIEMDIDKAKELYEHTCKELDFNESCLALGNLYLTNKSKWFNFS